MYLEFSTHNISYITKTNYVHLLRNKADKDAFNRFNYLILPQTNPTNQLTINFFLLFYNIKYFTYKKLLRNTNERMI